MSTPSASSASSGFFASLPANASSSVSGPAPVEEKPIQHNKETAIIFDWDDTLLCSTFLSGKGYRLDSGKISEPEINAGLRELETSVIAVLKLALSYGPVHIVTNAETGWVQLSAQKFIPAVVPLLSKVNIISARSTYEGMFPDSPLKWKFYAMQERLAAAFATTQKERNVLSFGDSHVEREAVRAVTRAMTSTRCKSVKFAERPSIEQLRRQIDLVSNCFAYVHNHDGDLDLQLTVTVNPTPVSVSTSSSTSSLREPNTPSTPIDQSKFVQQSMQQTAGAVRS